MQAQTSPALDEFGRRFTAYLPTLVAGLVILALGVAVGWVVKHVVIRVLIWMRLDRVGARVGWRATLGRGDIRAALYDTLGNIAMALVVLVFLNNALDIWGLTVLSNIVEKFNAYLPHLALAALTIGLGVFLANVVAARVESVLEDEGAPRPRLIAKIFKAALLAIVGALALWQLNFAREIVLSAFLIAFGAIGVAFAMAVGLGSARAIQQGWNAMFDKRKDS